MSMSRIGPNQVQPTTATYSSQAVSNKVGGGGRGELPVADKADRVTLSVDRQQGVQTPVADNKTTDTAANAISQMKGQLDAIVKNYPPYPIGDSNRAQYLKTFSGLRKEIESMTIPRDVEIPELSVSSNDAEVAAAAHKLDIIINKINGNSGGNISDVDVGEISMRAGYDLKGASVGITTQPKAFLSLLG